MMKHTNVKPFFIDNLIVPWEIVHAFLPSADRFKINLFEIFFSGIPSEYQIDWINCKPCVLYCLIWIQTVCKAFQKTTLSQQ